MFPATVVVALSLYFMRLPLLLTLPLAFGPWLVWAVAGAVQSAVVNKRQESLESRYKRWYGPRWREELAMIGGR